MQITGYLRLHLRFPFASYYSLATYGDSTSVGASVSCPSFVGLNFLVLYSLLALSVSIDVSASSACARAGVIGVIGSLGELLNLLSVATYTFFLAGFLLSACS